MFSPCGRHCFFILFFGCATWRMGSYFPDQGSNPRPLHWELRVLTTRPPRKSQVPVADILNPERVLPGLKEDASHNTRFC